MKPALRTALALAGIAALAAAAWWLRLADSPAVGRIEVAGNVRAQQRSVTAPQIAYPTPDYAVGIPSARVAAGGFKRTSGAQPSAARGGAPALSGALATVTVSLGDRVRAGDVVAALDPALLELGVSAARAAAERADADLALVGDNLETIEDNRSKLANAKAELASGKAQLRTTRAQLVVARADLAEARAKAETGRSAIRAQIEQLESIPTTLTPQQSQALLALKAKLGELDAGIRSMEAGAAKLDDGIATIDTALAKLPSAAARLSTATSALSSAEDQLTTARDTLRIVAEGQRVAVRLAEARRDSASITAPTDGVITFVRPAGTVVMVGAPIVRIRPDGPCLVDTYLTAEQLARVGLGAAAEVTCDSFPGRRFDARIVRFGALSEFPPTSFPTDLIHMTRAVRVTASLTDGQLPPGTPVDLVIRTDKP